MELKIEKVLVRVHHEPTHSEVYITNESPLINMPAIHFPGGVKIESGFYDLILTKRDDTEPPAEEKTEEEKSVE